MHDHTQLEQSIRTLVSQGKLVEARNILIDAERDQPDNGKVLFLLGTVESMAGNLKKARAWLEKSVDTGSRNPLCYFRLGQVCSQLEHNNAAISNYRKALDIQPNLVQARLLLTGLLKLQRQFEKASKHLELALRLQPSADGYADLAQLFEHINRLEDATHAARHALQLEPGNISAMIALGNLEKRAGNFNQAAALFRKAASNPKRNGWVASSSIYLGQTLDRQGQYAEAFAAFEAGNAIWSGIADDRRLDRKEMPTRVAHCAEYVQSGAVKRWSNESWKPNDSRHPPIFFVGFPRSGTTLVERILDQHPRIVSSQERPLLYCLIQQLGKLIPAPRNYPHCLDDLTCADMDRLRKAYWSKAEKEIGGLKPDSILLDKLPLNIISLIPARLFPDARILVALRDPRDVCLSCFMQAFALNTGMVQFLSLESTARFYSEVMGLWLRYRRTLPIKWYQYRYEDLVDDFDGVTRGIFDYLNLEYPDDTREYHASTRNKLLATPSYQDVSTPIYSRAKARWKNYEAQLEPVMHYLEPYIKEFGYQL